MKSVNNHYEYLYLTGKNLKAKGWKELEQGYGGT